MAEKITRDAFLYLAPGKGQGKDFAQCGTCLFFVDSVSGSCHVVTGKIKAEGSCGFYVEGDDQGGVMAVDPVISPAEAGYVERRVRCENCASFRAPSACALYKKINALLPALFDLEETVEAKACCNAQTPRKPEPDETKAAMGRAIETARRARQK